MVDLEQPPFLLERLQARRNIAFIKTHKTASSALRHALDRYGKRYGLKPLFDEVDGSRQGFIPQATLSELEPPYELSTRHLRYDQSLFDSLMTRPTFVSIVREPLDRAFSHFHYLNPNREEYSGFDDYYLNRDPNNQIVAQGFDNYLTTWLGFDSSEKITLKALRQRYLFIGVQERFHESLVILSKLLNCPVEVLWHEQVRVNHKKPPLKIAAEVRRQFLQNNAQDQKIYDLACEQLEIDIIDYGRHFERDCDRLLKACKAMSTASE